MVHITEMRIVMPLTLDEFKRGQRYGNWKTNIDNKVEGQGGTLLSSSPYFDDTYGEGVFTHTVYRLGNRLPDWVSKLVPSDALVVDEKSWITFPYFKSILTIPFFSRLKIEVVTIHKQDDGSTENAIGLSEEELSICKIDMVDIGKDPVAERDYKTYLDPSLVCPKTLQRGPLTHGWQQRETVLMCAYKVVKAEASYWGLSSRAEKLMISSMRQIFLLAHKNCFCLADEWANLSFVQVMLLENGSSLEEVTAQAMPGLEESREEGEEYLFETVLDEEVVIEAAMAEEDEEVVIEKAMAEEEVGLHSEGETRVKEESKADEIMEAVMVEDAEVSEIRAVDSVTSEVQEVELEIVTVEQTIGHDIVALEQKEQSGVVAERALEKGTRLDKNNTNKNNEVGNGDQIVENEENEAENLEFEGQEAATDGQTQEGSELVSGRMEIEEEVEKGGEKHASLAEDSSDDSLDVEFHEAQMEWNLQEEISGSNSFSGFGDMHSPKQREATPKHCPVCAVSGRKGKPSYFCNSCGEFFCDDCYLKFHVTKSLRKHKWDPVSMALGTSGTGNEGSQSDEASIMSTEFAAYLSDVKSNVKRDKKSWKKEFKLTKPVKKALPFAEDSSSSIPSTVGAVKKWGKSSFPSLNLPGIEFVRDGIVSTAHETEKLRELFPVDKAEAKEAVTLSQRIVSLAARIFLKLGGHSEKLPEETPVDLSLQSELDSFRFVALNLSNSVSFSKKVFTLPESSGPSKTADPPSVLNVSYLEISESKLEEIVPMILRLKQLTVQLASIDISLLSDEERLCFWINVFNGLVMHGYLTHGIPNSIHRRVILMQKCSYIISGESFCILAIEHNILRAFSHHPALAGLLPIQRFKISDRRHFFCLRKAEPLVTFALSCGTKSSPTVRVYSPERIRTDLTKAAKEYLSMNVDFFKGKKVLIPKLLQWYGKDFADSNKELLYWIQSNLPPEKKHLVEEFVESKEIKIHKITKVADYDWKFNYSFSL